MPPNPSFLVTNNSTNTPKTITYTLLKKWVLTCTWSSTIKLAVSVAK